MEETISVRDRLIALCQEHAHVIEDYPFGDSEWTVMRHEGNRKTFAYIYERNGEDSRAERLSARDDSGNHARLSYEQDPLDHLADRLRRTLPGR